MSAIRDFMERHYRHFNAREVVDAARAYEEHVDAGGKMLVAMAGAMSTGEFGVILADMIRREKVHAISCTGANLEEDVFNLVAHDKYEIVRSWRELSAADEHALYERGMNRVTDTCIPETVMRHVEGRLLERWQAASEEGRRGTPADFLFEVLACLAEMLRREDFRALEQTLEDPAALAPEHDVRHPGVFLAHVALVLVEPLGRGTENG